MKSAYEVSLLKYKMVFFKRIKKLIFKEYPIVYVSLYLIINNVTHILYVAYKYYIPKIIRKKYI